jgi:hypothetical protein
MSDATVNNIYNFYDLHKARTVRQQSKYEEYSQARHPSQAKLRKNVVNILKAHLPEKI